MMGRWIRWVVRGGVELAVACFLLTASLEQLKQFFDPDPFRSPPPHSEYPGDSQWSGFNTSELARRHALAGARMHPQERLALTLSFTHDPLPDWYMQKKQRSFGVTSRQQVMPVGGSSSRGGAGQGLDGDGETDARNVWNEDQVQWQDLDWISLPGSPGKAPRWDGPYHRMLDWYVWNHLQENAVGTKEPRPGGGGAGGRGRRPLHVPPAVSALASKVLAGDTMALALLHSEPAHALPSAVKAEWWRYSFADPGTEGPGTWWKRSRATDQTPVVWTRLDVSAEPVRRGLTRSSIMILSMLGLVFAIHFVLDSLCGPCVPLCGGGWGGGGGGAVLWAVLWGLVMCLMFGATGVLSWVASYQVWQPTGACS
jgi:hypothetical protein